MLLQLCLDLISCFPWYNLHCQFSSFYIELNLVKLWQLILRCFFYLVLTGNRGITFLQSKKRNRFFQNCWISLFVLDSLICQKEKACTYYIPIIIDLQASESSSSDNSNVMVSIEKALLFCILFLFMYSDIWVIIAYICCC